MLAMYLAKLNYGYLPHEQDYVLVWSVIHWQPVQACPMFRPFDSGPCVDSKHLKIHTMNS